MNITTNHLTTATDNIFTVQKNLPQKSWLVACLCAAWCDTCQAYRTQFDALQVQHPDTCFAWIDIEDYAELIDDVNIDNFPTILIQHNDQVAFFGTMLPDAQQVHRLLLSLIASHTDIPDGVKKPTPILNQALPLDWNLRHNILMWKEKRA